MSSAAICMYIYVPRHVDQQTTHMDGRLEGLDNGCDSLYQEHQLVTVLYNSTQNDLLNFLTSWKQPGSHDHFLITQYLHLHVHVVLCHHGNTGGNTQHVTIATLPPIITHAAFAYRVIHYTPHVHVHVGTLWTDSVASSICALLDQLQAIT